MKDQNQNIKKAARLIAEEIRDAFTSNSNSRSIGFDENGNVDFSYEGIAFEVYNTDSDWIFGEFHGDYTDENDWDDGDIEAIAEMFEEEFYQRNPIGYINNDGIDVEATINDVMDMDAWK